MATPLGKPLPDQPHTPTAAQSDALARIKQIVGPKGWTTDPGEMAPALEDWRGLYQGQAQMLVRPASTEEVSQILAVCRAARLPLVPQGGNTGMVGGSVPYEEGEEIVLSLARMNTIRDIDPANGTMTVEAGCVLATLQQIASDADRYFPLSLGAEGSCMIGGNLSTNAGGTNVLRYGNARDQVLGLEVVLPDGRMLNLLTSLRKDNTGYDLKQLFLGAEGTLGVITAAVVKLHPKPRDIRAAFAAVRDVDAAIELLNRMGAESGGAVETFELIPRLVIDLVLKHIPGTQDPLPGHDMYVMVELVTTASGDDRLGERLETILGAAMEDGLVLDATLTQSEQQRQAFWQIRDSVSESQKLEGASIKHDVSVPVSRLPEFYREAADAVHALDPAVRIVAFGHAGDGNLHYNIAEPEGGTDRAAFLARWSEFNRAVHDVVQRYGGSISAEHGIGRLKRDELPHYKDPVALDVMRVMKAALDPNGIMNPGKVI